MFRRIVVPAIAVVWGSLILISFFSRGGIQGSGSYAAGEMIGIVIGILMVVAGVVALTRKKPA